MHGGDDETGIWRHVAPCVVFVQQENCMVYVNTHQMQNMKCPSGRVGGVQRRLQRLLTREELAACKSLGIPKQPPRRTLARGAPYALAAAACFSF